MCWRHPLRLPVHSWGLSECLLVPRTSIATMCSESLLCYLLYLFSLLLSAAPSSPPPHTYPHIQCQQEAQIILHTVMALQDDVIGEKEL